MQDSKTKKGIGAVAFFCLGFGAIVGVGWAVSVNGWMADSGGPVPAALGYLVTLILMVPIALCYCELVPMYPVAGGGMAFAYQAFNEKTAFVSGWAAVGGFIGVIPWEAIQVTDVLSYLIPGILEGEPLYTVAGTGIYLPTILIGVVCSFLLFALNMRGVESSAMVQKVLCFVLVGAGLIGSLTSFNSLGVMLSWVITAWCLVRLRKTRPDAPRPYRIPGGIWTGIFAGVVSAVVFVLLFIPNGPAFVGKVTVLMFVGWMVIGLVLYLASAPQRRAMSPEEREKQMFAHASQQGE